MLWLQLEQHLELGLEMGLELRLGGVNGAIGAIPSDMPGVGWISSGAMGTDKAPSKFNQGGCLNVIALSQG